MGTVVIGSLEDTEIARYPFRLRSHASEIVALKTTPLQKGRETYDDIPVHLCPSN